MRDEAHVQVDATTLSAHAAYRLLTGVVVPRPIAWVTSIDIAGTLNLAPFSAFTMVSNAPPMVGINIGRRDGALKDTAVNIETSGEYVVNIGGWDHHPQIHRSGEPHPAGINEAELLGLATLPSEDIAVPRLATARASLECRLDCVTSFGRGGSRFVVGEVLRFHVLEDLLDDGKIDTVGLDPAARLAGPTYGRIGSTARLAATPQ